MPRLPDVTSLGSRPSLAMGAGLAQYRVSQSNVGQIVQNTGRIVDASANEVSRAASFTSQIGSSLKSASNEIDQATGELTRRMKVEQDRMDTLKAEDAFTRLRETQLDLTVGPQNGFTRVTGGAANREMLTTWQQKFQDASKSIEEGLENDEQRARYRLRAQASGLQFQHELLNHLAKESDVYAKEVFEGIRNTEVRNAAARWNDPEAVALSLQRVDAAVADRAERMNWPKEYAEAMRLETAGKIHSGVIQQAIASGQWQYAQKWFEANKADVDPGTAKVLEKAVEDGTQKQLVAGYTSDFLAARDNRKGLDALEKRINADTTLDETRKNALLGRVMSRGEILDRRAEAEQVRRERMVERSITQVNSATLAGFEPSVEQLAPIVNSARGTALEGDARQMVQLANATRQFRLSPPQAQEAYLTRLETEARQNPGKFDIQWLNAFRTIYQKQQAAVKEDPTSFAVRQGLVEPSSPAAQPLDLTKPQALGVQLMARFSLARSMSDRYQAPFKPLTKEESDLLSGFLSKATVSQKREYFGSLSQAASGDMDGFRAMMGQIAHDDPVTAIGGVYAGRGYRQKDGDITTGNGTAVSDLIFRGQALLRPNAKEDGTPDKGKLWPMPAGTDEANMRKRFADLERDAFAGLGDARNGYYQAARAVYAAMSEQAGDSSGTLNQSRWEQAIRLATGGFAKVNGKTVVLPYGHNESMFKNGLAARVDALASAGALPDGVTPQRLLDLPLEVAGDGKYVFRAGDAVVLDKTGAPIIIDFNRTLPFRPSGMGAPPKDGRPKDAYTKALERSWPGQLLGLGQ